MTYTICKVYPYGAVELEDKQGGTFKVNGQCLKHYWYSEVERIESSLKLADP